MMACGIEAAAERMQALILEGFNCSKNMSRINYHLQLQLLSIVEKISDSDKRWLQRSRVALKTMFSSLNFLAQKGLGIPGAGDSHESNLMQLL